MAKKDKTPLLLKVIRWLFPKLERLSPTLAAWYFRRVFFKPLRYPIPDKEKPLLQQAHRFTVTAAGLNIQGYSWGEPTHPMVLLVHGWAGRCTQFRKFIPALLAQGYFVVGFDGPAHGLSQGSRTHILEFEAALLAVIEKTKQPVAIITHSFGGAASLLAIANGLRVNTLINIASPTIGDEIINTYLRAINGSDKIRVLFKQYIQKTYDKAFEEFTALHFINKIKYPLRLLLIYDEHDEEVTLAHPYALMERYPAAELMVTTTLGHTRILKDDAVVQRALQFIKG